MTWAWQIQSIFGVTIDYFGNKAKSVPATEKKKKIELFSSESNRPKKVEIMEFIKRQEHIYQVKKIRSKKKRFFSLSTKVGYMLLFPFFFYLSSFTNYRLKKKKTFEEQMVRKKGLYECSWITINYCIS